MEISTATSNEITFQRNEILWQRVLLIVGIALLCLIALFALIGPHITGYAYDEIHLAQKNEPPSLNHWFGTDDLGRDLFTRVWYGARISLFVGISAAIIDLILGVLWGGIAAFAGGKIDELMMRIADILYALPYLLVVILIMVILGNGLLPIILAMTIIGWITMSRVVRGQILQIKQQEYVLASKSLGASFLRILFKDLIPNCIGSILVTLTLTIPSAIFVEAYLSFLGLGIQAPMASWGTMAHEGLPAISYYPWRLLFPAAIITLTILAFNLIGEGIRSILEKE